MVADLLDTAADLPTGVLYLVTWLLAFGESVFLLDLVMPGEAGMVVAGASGHRAGEPLVALIAVASFGAIAGDSVSYTIGRRYGSSVVERWSLTRRHLKPKLEHAHAHFEKRGGASVFVGRWVGALRAVVPLVAGAAGMPYRRFLLWDAAGCITWTTAVVVLGYVVGSRIADAVDRAGGLISLAVVAAIVGYLGFRAWRRRTTTNHASGRRATHNSHG